MLIFEDCANSALPARFLPLPRRFSASEWRGMLPAACFVCAERTVRYAAPPPPLRGPYLFCAGMARCASGGPFFSVLPEKNGEKRGAGGGIALSRLKKHFASACHSLIVRSARNALRAVRRISAIQKSCCGKYFCLQNRKVFALNPCGAFRFCPFLLRSLYGCGRETGQIKSLKVRESGA